jgi:hypothetical protein
MAETKTRELTDGELAALEQAAMGEENVPVAPAEPAAAPRALSDVEIAELERVALAAPPAPAADPGLAKTLGRGLLQGFFKQGADEAVGGIASAAADAGPGARYRMPDGTTRPVESSGALYRAARDGEREVERGAREHRPKTAFVANLVGDLASDAALSALGVPVASTPFQVASGALSGLLGNDAELSTDAVAPDAATSAAASTALGAGAGYVLPKVGTQVGRALPGVMARLRQGLEGSALDKARKVLTSGADQLSNRQPVANEAVREALDSGAIPIWGTTEGAFKRLEDLAETRGASYAGIVGALEKAGVPGPNSRALADQLLARAKTLDLTETNKAIPSEYRNVTNTMLDMGELAEQRGIAQTGRLNLKQAEDIKRSLQKQVKYGRREDTPLNEARAEIASMVRQANEDTIEAAGERAPAGSEVARLAEEFVPVKRQLSRTLEARNAAERGAAKAAQRVGGASGITPFDVANAATATGTQGLPAMMLAGAGRIWRERGPSTLANLYDVGAEAAGNLSRAAYANPETTQALSRAVFGAGGRQANSSDTMEALQQRALADYLMRRRAGGGR